MSDVQRVIESIATLAIPAGVAGRGRARELRVVGVCEKHGSLRTLTGGGTPYLQLDVRLAQVLPGFSVVFGHICRRAGVQRMGFGVMKMTTRFCA